MTSESKLEFKLVGGQDNLLVRASTLSSVVRLKKNARKRDSPQPFFPPNRAPHPNRRGRTSPSLLFLFPALLFLSPALPFYCSTVLPFWRLRPGDFSVSVISSVLLHLPLLKSQVPSLRSSFFASALRTNLPDGSSSDS